MSHDVTPYQNIDCAWFRLMYAKGVGHKALWELGVHCGEHHLLSDNFDQDWPILSQTSLAGREHELRDVYANSNLRLQWYELSTKGVKLLHPQHHLIRKGALKCIDLEAGYRSGLPAIVCYWGSIDSLAYKPTVGIVGAREASNYVIDATQQLAHTLSAQGISIISGYARGVDTYAHAGALTAQGNTVAILPHGITNIFSKAEEQPRLAPRLSRHVAYANWHEHMLFVSQFYPTRHWKAQHYILRNNTICALSEKIIVMSAQHAQSGSYQTGALAYKLGIPLYVFMPKRQSEQSAGNRGLCKQYNAIPVHEEELLVNMSMQHLPTSA